MRYHIITYGCQANKSDSERITSVLEGIGYKPASKEKDADLIVVNMCSVRQSAVDRVYGLWPKFEKLKKENSNLKTILTGCVLKENKKKFAKRFDLILDIKDLSNWPNHLKLKNVTSLPWQSYDVNNCYLKIQSKYQNKFSAFIPISNGCNNACTYCVVPFTRGHLICRPYEEILKEVKNAVRNGAKEIWLLGQNVNDYVSRIDTNLNSRIFANKISKNSRVINFAKLLKMVNNILGDFSIRFMSPNPKNFSDELIDVMAKSKKIAKYLNLPVQSGDDGILKKMNRPYTVEQYKDLVKKIREKMPEINLSTDVIIGFPGETKKQFENTVNLFKEIKFNIAYISKYSPRQGTVAQKMKDNVPWQEKKRREKNLREILNKKLCQS